MGDLHWLRPLWLWMLVPWALMLFYWLRRSIGKSAWERVVEPALQPYVIDGDVARTGPAPVMLFTGWLLGVVLLAGPVWNQLEVPVFQAQQAEIILLDLSNSMLTDDIAPDRLTRARFKVADLLAQSEGRQIGLIGFTERPYVISPLTEDTQTITAFLPSLSPDIMPVQGSRLDLAIEKAIMLFAQAGVSQGHILYVGDQPIGEADLAAARQARQAGHRLSVLAVGTAAGRPLRDNQGQFVKDAAGAIVVPQIDMAAMDELASNGAGRAARISADNQDLEVLSSARDDVAIEASGLAEGRQQTYWIEYSPWLLWPLAFAALWLFRRGVVA